MTSNSSLEDAFKDLYFTKRKDYNSTDTLRAFKTTSTNVGTNFSFPVDNLSLAPNLSLNGGLEISPSLDFTIDIRNYGLRYAKIEARYNRTLSLGVNLNGSISNLAVSRKLMPDIPLNFILVPGVPIVIFPLFSIDIGVEGSATVGFGMSQINTSNIRAYAEFKNGNWSSGYSKENNNTITSTGINGDAELKVYIEPKVDFIINNLTAITSTIGTRLYLKGKASSLPKPSCEISAGISAEASIGVNLFFQNLSTNVSLPIFDFSTVLYQCYKPKVQTILVTTEPCDTAITQSKIIDSGSSTILQRGVCWNTFPEPTLANFKKGRMISSSDSNHGLGLYSDTLSGLHSDTTYYLRAFAINETDTAYGEQFTFTPKWCRCVPGIPYIVDIDSNKYKVIQIGNQIWMKENLRTSRYRNGEPIMNLISDAQWSQATNDFGAWCSVNNNAANDSLYGKHYNWFAVSDQRGVCPAGWHVPNVNEWEIMFSFFGGRSIAGTALKAKSGWYINGTNESCFTTTPAGWRTPNYGAFLYKGSYASFWTSEQTPNTPIEPWLRQGINFVIDGSYPNVGQGYFSQQEGMSVRCIKD